MNTPPTRRDFLCATVSSLGLAFLDVPPGFSLNDVEKQFAEIRLNLLQMINEERAVEKLSTLKLDELATKVATKHALDMVGREFASHWGSDGLKPYQRYSLAGGTDATQENVSAADNTWSTKFDDLKQDSAYLHLRLYQETPPNDGHRKTILAPHHTHVGFGIALEKLRLRLVELFVAKYIEVKPLERAVRPGSTVPFRARILNSAHPLNYIEVFYEPLPKSPELSWLQQPRSYGLPIESRRLLPKLTAPLRYADGSTGTVQISPDGTIAAPVVMFKSEPGIYTVVCWMRKSRTDKAFPATEVCLRAE